MKKNKKVIGFATFLLLSAINLFIVFNHTQAAEYEFRHHIFWDWYGYYKQCPPDQYFAGCVGKGDECLYEIGECYNRPQ